ncbi:MAG: tetratricopeptide repeat protein [Sandaracinus sp.]|nr:tetratricopeptide repeat protein [Sandaracinus sp.]MCB9614013.1 tetratricopeptide repeat protein [Sandaracinus sp.]MCB9620765.1 tetratricopeptide repeat protein [Sandaracinus sp.]MCB9636491.1 tetratricopeptide repeat protein [Sandaracinus sp.]
MAVDRTKVLAAAQKHLAKGAYDRAIAEYQKLVEADPRDVRTLLKIGDLYTRKGANREATDTYHKVAEHYATQGFFLKAVAVYKQILKLQPGRLDITLRLAEMYENLQLVSDALQTYEQVAGAYAREGNIDRALATLGKMTELDPENVPIRIKYAEALSKASRTDQAATEFEEGARLLEEQGRIDDYLKVAERLLFHRPNDSDLARKLARLYLERDDAKRALAKLQLCFKQDPRDVRTLELLAEAFLALGQTPKTVSVYREIARIHQESNRPDARAQVLKRILEIDPQDAEARQALAGYAQPSVRPPAAQVDAMPPGALVAPPEVEELDEDEELELLEGDDVEEEVLVVEEEVEVDFEEPAAASVPPPDARASIPPDVAREAQIARLLTECDVFERYGLREKVIAQLETVLQLEPGHVEARERLKDAYIAAGRPSDAARELVRLAHLYDDRPQLAQLYLRQAVELDPAAAIAAGYRPSDELREAAPAPAAAPSPPSDELLFLDDRASEPEVLPAEEPRASEPDLVFLDEPRMSDPELVYEEDEDFDEPVFEEPAPAYTAPPAPVSAHPAFDEPVFEEPAAQAAFDEPVFEEPAGDEPDLLFLDDSDVDRAPVLPAAPVAAADDFDDATAFTPAAALFDPPTAQSERPPAAVEDPFDDATAFTDSAAFAASMPHVPAEPDDTLGGLPRAELEAAGLPPMDGPPELGGPLELAGPLELSGDDDTLGTMSREELEEAGVLAVPTPEGAPTGEVPAHVAEAQARASLPPGEVEETLDEVDFFLAQGLFDAAKNTIEDALSAHPGHPLLEEKLEEITELQLMSRAAYRPPVVSDEDEAFALAERLAEELGDEHVEDLSGSDVLDVDEVFEQFKKGVEQQIGLEDTDTHFDLGIAYKEMGLLEDAMKEFELAMRNPQRECICQTMVGLCYMEQGKTTDAISRFKRGLYAEAKTDREELGLYFELGHAYEMLQDPKEALYYFQKVAKRDPDFREVGSRIANLTNPGDPGQPPPEALVLDDVDAAFDDLLGDD